MAKSIARARIALIMLISLTSRVLRPDSPLFGEAPIFFEFKPSLIFLKKIVVEVFGFESAKMPDRLFVRELVKNFPEFSGSTRTVI
jgi:hypothetical protein